MVDVSDKPVTARIATAVGTVTCAPETLERVRSGTSPKGSVISVAELAGIMGAKRTAELIPLCHPLPLTKVAVRVEIDDDLPGFRVESEVRTQSVTGVEMEALTAVSVACLTLFDMLKAARPDDGDRRNCGHFEDRRQIGRLAQGMISFDEAIELVRSVAVPLGTETVPVEKAAGRVLAEPVIAQIDSPRADVSAMDGYAVRQSDLASFPLRLKVIGESFAGASWNGTVTRGSCARIFTGAPLPAGSDRVIVQEDVHRDGDLAVISEHPSESRHVRRRGSDFQTGEELLPARRLLDPRAIVAAAAADVASVEVFRQPRLHVLSTGDELAEPGTARERPDAIPESVSFGVAALAEQWGATCVGRSRVGDDLAAMKSVAETALDAADLVVVTGGASVGERDFAKAMFEPLGLELVFSKVAIKPGKPVWMGRIGDRLVLGLPGNPTSALVTARLVLAPLLALMQGRPTGDALKWTDATLASPLPACGPRETFHRATLRNGKANILAFQDSHAQKALAEADVLLRQRANCAEKPAGERVEFSTSKSYPVLR